LFKLCKKIIKYHLSLNNTTICDEYQMLYYKISPKSNILYIRINIVNTLFSISMLKKCKIFLIIYDYIEICLKNNNFRFFLDIPIQIQMQNLKIINLMIRN